MFTNQSFQKALTGVSQEVSTKLDFGEESSPVITNSSREDDDVEVKHTIVVSTKFKNTNRRAGLQGNGKIFRYLDFR